MTTTPTPEAVRVCPDRDTECGNNSKAWCAKCPKHGAETEAPYRVAEFWSSANPGTKVRMLAEGSDIEYWGKRGDFIRWVDSGPAPASRTPDLPWHERIIGMEVSMDVSTGDDDAGHRIFGTVCEVMLAERGAGTNTILVIEESRNFAPPAGLLPKEKP